jgi:ubiquinone/menaquinone biosynthesis C-methylase UbiE
MPRLLDPEGAHAAAIRSLADLRGRRVLEVGCGDGRLTEALAGDAASWVATDPNSNAVDEARRMVSPALAGRVTFAVAGGAEIEANECEFDLVLFSWSL